MFSRLPVIPPGHQPASLADINGRLNIRSIIRAISWQGTVIFVCACVLSDMFMYYLLHFLNLITSETDSDCTL